MVAVAWVRIRLWGSGATQHSKLDWAAQKDGSMVVGHTGVRDLNLQIESLKHPQLSSCVLLKKLSRHRLVISAFFANLITASLTKAIMYMLRGIT